MEYFEEYDIYVCGLCESVVPYCVACWGAGNGTVVGNSSEITCVTCMGGMYLANNGCKPCPKGCAMCTNASSCLSCSFFYYYSNATQQCLQCLMPGCSKCTNPSLCQKCLPSYYMASNNQSCIACPSSCFTCLSPTQCLSCVIGYALSNGSCLACTPNCAVCARSTSICQSCMSGFYLSSSVSSASLFGGSSVFCIPCPTYCRNCGSEYYCFSCTPGSYLAPNSICR